MRTRVASIVRIGAYLVLATVTWPGAGSASVRSYVTNGLTVVHNTADEGMYYNTPSCEVAYNTQIMRVGTNTYWTIYHSEPNKPACSAYPGDSIKTGGYTGNFTYVMPSAGFRLYGHPTDTYSTLYSPEQHGTVGWGGAGNPIVVKGRLGDNYYYAFFIGVVADDLPDRNTSHSDFRHYLFQARSLNVVDWELKTEISGTICWKPFNPTVDYMWRRARSIQDVNGNTIMSQRATVMSATQGLLGSICYYNYTYYYFYTDVAADGNMYLYIRTCADVTGNNVWSAATAAAGPLMNGMIPRIAKAHGLDRWAVLYNGYKTGPTQELMLQYTQNMNVIGTGGLSDLTFYDSFYLPQYYGYTYGISDKYLGLASGNGRFGQHYFMTDEYGNLTVPNQEAQDYTRGGMVTWTAFTGSVYGDKVYRAGWSIYLKDPPVATAMSISDARKAAIGSYLSCSGYVSAGFSVCFYLESGDRVDGIRVWMPGYGLSVGRMVTVTGWLREDQSSGELYIDAAGVADGQQTGLILPLGMTNRALGGGAHGQPGIDGATGLNNIGLLIKTTGAVTESHASDTPAWFKIDDGSGVGVKVLGVVPGGTTYVAVTGISSCEKDSGGHVQRVVISTQVDDLSH